MYTVKRRNPNEVVALCTRLSDAFTFLSTTDKEPVGTYYIEDVHHVTYFNEYLTEYRGYVLLNDIYEDEDHRTNTYQFGISHGDYVENPQKLKGLSSNSYAPWEEVEAHFKTTVDCLHDGQKSVE